MKAYIAGFLIGAAAFGQDGQALLHKMQRALGGAGQIEKIRDFEQLVRAETWDRQGRPIGQVRKRTRWIKPNYLRLDQVGPGDTYALYFDGTSGWEILPGKRQVVDLAGGELQFAKRYLSGFALNIWLADRNPEYEISSPARNVVGISTRKSRMIGSTLRWTRFRGYRLSSLPFRSPIRPIRSPAKISSKSG